MTLIGNFARETLLRGEEEENQEGTMRLCHIQILKFFCQIIRRGRLYRKTIFTLPDIKEGEEEEEEEEEKVVVVEDFIRIRSLVMSM